MKCWQLFFLIIFTTLSVFSVTASPTTELLPASWLLNNKAENVIIVDVRAKQDYLHGHIPNAVNLPVDETFSNENKKGLVASPGHIQSLFKSVGINNNSHIIVYDDGYFINSARMIWVLQVYGITKISLIDGGMLAWLAIDGKISVEPAKIQPGNFIPTLDPKHLSTQFSMYLGMNDSQTQLIDSRKNIEYIGIESKAKRKGHIPTAENIPSAVNFDIINGVPRLKSSAKLRKIYADFDINKPVITYCNKGKESALTHFVLGQLGFEVSAYDAGWIEWGNDDSLPIEVANKK